MNNNTGAVDSNSYSLTSLPSLNNGGISGLNFPLPTYQSLSTRPDSGSIKVESPENLSAHAQYGTPSPGNHHSGIEHEHLQGHSHSINSMGISQSESGNLGPVSVGAS